MLASPVYTGTAQTGQAHRSGASLSDRLNAVARLVQIGSARSGQEGFDPGLLADAEALLARAGERLRLSAHHTIVVLAGGTGSGKSSLFNQLAGAHFSPVGPVQCAGGGGAGPDRPAAGRPARPRLGRDR